MHGGQEEGHAVDTVGEDFIQPSFLGRDGAVLVLALYIAL